MVEIIYSIIEFFVIISMILGVFSMFYMSFMRNKIRENKDNKNKEKSN